MSEPVNLKIENERLLTLAGNLLHGYFIKPNKDLGKKRFKEVADGKVIKLGALGAQSGEHEVDLNLLLDSTEYNGHLTFHVFGQALDALLRSFHQHLKNKMNLRLFTNEKTGAGLFLIPGIVEENSVVNMLVLGIEAAEGNLSLKLQFIDPDQFQSDDQTAASTEG